MALLGNILWVVFGGWLLFLLYTLAAVVFFPFFLPIFRVARYALWPYGRGIVTQSQLKKYREIKGIESNDDGATAAIRNISGLLNIIWMLLFGWLLALAHLLAAFANAAFFWLIVTIPNIGANFKLIRVAFLPFNKVIVPKKIAEEIKEEITKKKLNI